MIFGTGTRERLNEPLLGIALRFRKVVLRNVGGLLEDLLFDLS